MYEPTLGFDTFNITKRIIKTRRFGHVLWPSLMYENVNAINKYKE